MPDPDAVDRLDTELRRIAHALVAQAPAAPERARRRCGHGV
jgi:hypothetical protein